MCSANPNSELLIRALLQPLTPRSLLPNDVFSVNDPPDLHNNLGDMCDYLHFTPEKTEAQKFDNVPTNTEL